MNWLLPRPNLYKIIHLAFTSSKWRLEIGFLRAIVYFQVSFVLTSIMLKRELRKVFLARRAELSPVEYGSMCVRLCNRLFDEIDLKNAKVVHTFLAIDKHKEPDTWLIIDKLGAEFPHIRISVPRIIANTNSLENYYLDSLKQLITNDLGIPEPASGLVTPAEEIDIVLIPLIAFDTRGHRVGYGKGFYDKFLKQCRPNTLRVGLSLFEPVEEISDVYDQDERMHYCITPDNTFRFRPQVPADSGSGKTPDPR